MNFFISNVSRSMRCIYNISWGESRSARKREEVEDVFFEQVCFFLLRLFLSLRKRFLCLCLAAIVFEHFIFDKSSETSTILLLFLSTDLISACKSALGKGRRRNSSISPRQTLAGKNICSMSLVEQLAKLSHYSLSLGDWKGGKRDTSRSMNANQIATSSMVYHSINDATMGKDVYLTRMNFTGVLISHWTDGRRIRLRRYSIHRQSARRERETDQHQSLMMGFTSDMREFIRRSTIH